MYPYKVEGISCIVLLETLRFRAFGGTSAPRTCPKEHNTTRKSGLHILDGMLFLVVHRFIHLLSRHEVGQLELNADGLVGNLKIYASASQSRFTRTPTFMEPLRFQKVDLRRR